MGWALDNFLVQDPHGEPFAEAEQLERLKTSIADALANKVDLALASPSARLHTAVREPSTSHRAFCSTTRLRTSSP